MNFSIFKAPSAWLPLAMSACALLVVAGHYLFAGAAREPDEQAAAHLWQVLMVGQAPLIGWHFFQRASKGPRLAVPVLATQLAALVVAAAPVALLGL